MSYNSDKGVTAIIGRRDWERDPDNEDGYVTAYRDAWERDRDARRLESAGYAVSRSEDDADVLPRRTYLWVIAPGGLS